MLCQKESALFFFSSAPFHQVVSLKAELAKAGLRNYSVYDLGWQTLHMAAAAACRGSTPTGGSGCCHNMVMVRNIADNKSCTQICAQTVFRNCDAEVSLYGKNGKAKKNGEEVGTFYNYDCNGTGNGGNEVSVADEDIMDRTGGNHYFSFCCCRK